jgi:hypothetical protein
MRHPSLIIAFISFVSVLAVDGGLWTADAFSSVIRHSSLLSEVSEPCSDTVSPVSLPKDTKITKSPPL